jgi:hypothetical protein
VLDRAKTRVPILLPLQPAEFEATPDENPPGGRTERAPPAHRIELPGPQAETLQLRTHGERIDVVLSPYAKAIASLIGAASPRDECAPPRLCAPHGATRRAGAPRPRSSSGPSTGRAAAWNLLGSRSRGTTPKRSRTQPSERTGLPAWERGPRIPRRGAGAQGRGRGVPGRAWKRPQMDVANKENSLPDSRRSSLPGASMPQGPRGDAPGHAATRGTRVQALWRRSGVSRRSHTPVRTGRSPRNPPESLVGRQGLEPWTLGLEEGSGGREPLEMPALSTQFHKYDDESDESCCGEADPRSARRRVS